MTFQFESLNAFFYMEGHGIYVWAGYAISLSVMLWLVVRPILARRKFVQQLAGQYKRTEARACREEQ